MVGQTHRRRDLARGPIIAAATKVACEDGGSAVTMGPIADRADDSWVGVSAAVEPAAAVVAALLARH